MDMDMDMVMDVDNVMMMMGNASQVFELAWYGETTKDDGTVCEVFPHKMYSSGIWEVILNPVIGQRFWTYKLPHLEITILAVFFFWQLFDLLFKKIRLPVPRFTSMMLAGFVLRVEAFCMGKNSIFAELIQPTRLRLEIPQTFGAFGFIIFWFLMGVKMDTKRIFMTETKCLVSGILTVLLPMIVGVIFYKKIYGNQPSLQGEFEMILITQSLSAFSGITKLLQDLKIIHSELGRLALATGLVSDFVGLFITILTIPFNKAIHTRGVYEMMCIVLFIIFAIKVVRPVMFLGIKQKREGRPVDEKYIYGCVLLLCLSYALFHSTGQYPALGPFILGQAIPDGPPLGSALVDRLEAFSIGIALPLFLSLNMMKIDVEWLSWDFWKFTDGGQMFATTSLILLVFLVKLFVSLVLPFLYRMPLKDSCVLSLIMNHKGIIELAFYAFALEIKGLSFKSFTVMAIFILLNSFVLPIAIGFLYDPSKQFACYQKRNFVHLKTGSELKTLVCIHRPDHITSMINILEACSQSKEYPLACYVLHLVELSGQATPALISHRGQGTSAGNILSHSENVILSFQHFNDHVGRSVSLDAFTSISVPSHMHDDICWLALDRTITLILLPFHRTWSLDRTKIVSDSEMIRYINNTVLKKAPCSVGILIDRQPIRDRLRSHKFSLKICMIFVGGRNDEEALAIARQMACNVSVSLTVLHLIPAGKSKEKSSEMNQMLESVELKEWVMRNSKLEGKGQHGSPTFLEEEVMDGTETSKHLKSMASVYDLFIVGRNRGVDSEVTMGLEDWRVFEELGLIGDFLASPDFESKASVLVVQHQRNLAKN